MQVQKRGKNLDKKLWLARYRELRDEADEWKAEADRQREELFPSAQNLSGMPRSPSPKNVDAIWAEHIDSIVKSESMMKKAKDALEEIQEAIEAVEDSDERTVLKNRYYFGYNWFTIADKMHRSTRAIHELHGSALENISVHTSSH